MSDQLSVNASSPKKSRGFGDLAARVAVAAVAIPVITWIVMKGGYPFFIFMDVVAGVALWEFYRLAQLKGVFPNIVLGLIFGTLISLPFMHERLEYDILSPLGLVGKPEVHYPSQLVVLVSLTLLSVFTVLAVEVGRSRTNALLNTSVTIFGVFYISMFLSCFIGIRELFGPEFPSWQFAIPVVPDLTKAQIIDRWGGYLVMSILASIWVCDSAAYFFGRFFGRHKLLERVSPGKTWEGAIAGFIASVGAILAARYFFLPFIAFRDAIVIGLIVGVFGQLGDLAESLLKRDAGAKDSSHIIPGHGGAFDRFDSLLFVAPLVYLYVYIIIAH
jgi:phosphatidate cytidylyltransferase